MRAVDGCAARTIMAYFQETKKAKKKIPHNLLKNFNWYKQFYTVYTHTWRNARRASVTLYISLTTAVDE